MDTISYGRAIMATIVTGLKYPMTPLINKKSSPTLKIMFKYISPKNCKMISDKATLVLTKF